MTDASGPPDLTTTEDFQAYTLAYASPLRFDEVSDRVRMVVSARLPVSAGKQYEKWLVAAVAELRPELRPFAPIVVVIEAYEEKSLAFAAGSAAIIVWFRRDEWYSGARAPLRVETIEHEAAHILALRTGRPSDGEWEAAMRADANHPDGELRECLMSQDIATHYSAEEWVREDWAFSVENSRDLSRFAKRFPSRAALMTSILKLASAEGQ